MEEREAEKDKEEEEAAVGDDSVWHFQFGGRGLGFLEERDCMRGRDCDVMCNTVWCGNVKLGSLRVGWVRSLMEAGGHRMVPCTAFVS